MTDVTGNQEIKFLLDTDDGSNNTYVYSYELYYIGDVKPFPDAPTPASMGAVYTGKYRNLFCSKKRTENSGRVHPVRNSKIPKRFLFRGSHGKG